MTNVIEISSADELQDLISTEDSVLVDVHAIAWCAPCRRIKPIFERRADEAATTFASVDLDDNTWAEVEYGVQGVPTLIHFENGEEVERITGVAAVRLINSVR